MHSSDTLKAEQAEQTRHDQQEDDERLKLQEIWGAIPLGALSHGVWLGDKEVSSIYVNMYSCKLTCIYLLYIHICIHICTHIYVYICIYICAYSGGAIPHGAVSRGVWRGDKEVLLFM